MSAADLAWREHEHARTSPRAECERPEHNCRTCREYDSATRWCGAVSDEVLSIQHKCRFWNGGES